MLEEVVLPHLFPVISRDDYQRVVEHSAPIELGQQASRLRIRQRDGPLVRAGMNRYFGGGELPFLPDPGICAGVEPDFVFVPGPPRAGGEDRTGPALRKVRLVRVEEVDEREEGAAGGPGLPGEQGGGAPR